jgi:hypothetical protein
MHHAILIDDYDEDGPTAVGAAPSHAFEGGVGDSRAGFSVRALVPAPPRIPLPEHAAKSARTRKREALQVLRPRIHTAPIVLAAQGLHTSQNGDPCATLESVRLLAEMSIADGEAERGTDMNEVDLRAMLPTAQQSAPSTEGASSSCTAAPDEAFAKPREAAAHWRKAERTIRIKHAALERIANGARRLPPLRLQAAKSEQVPTADAFEERVRILRARAKRHMVIGQQVAYVDDDEFWKHQTSVAQQRIILRTPAARDTGTIPYTLPIAANDMMWRRKEGDGRARTPRLKPIASSSRRQSRSRQSRSRQGSRPGSRQGGGDGYGGGAYGGRQGGRGGGDGYGGGVDGGRQRGRGGGDRDGDGDGNDDGFGGGGGDGSRNRRPSDSGYGGGIYGRRQGGRSGGDGHGKGDGDGDGKGDGDGHGYGGIDNYYKYYDDATRNGGRGGGKGGRAHGRGHGGGAHGHHWHVPHHDCDACFLKEADSAAGSPRSHRTGKSGWQMVKQSFDPHKSPVWAFRALASDAQTVFDTPEVEYKRFAADWVRIVAAGITKAVVRADDDGAADDDGDGIPDEVQEVGEVIWHHHRTLCVLFTYYAVQDTETLLTSMHCARIPPKPYEETSSRYSPCTLGSRPPLAVMTLNAWTLFVKDFHLASNRSKYCKQSDIDRLFIAVDKASKFREKEEERERAKRVLAGKEGAKAQAKGEERENALSRNEFLIALVHLAINKYVLTKEVPDVSKALDRLLEVDITAQLTHAHAHPDCFRRTHLYSQPVAQVFQFHMESLRQIFDGIANSRAGAGGPRKGGTIDIMEWMASLRALELCGDDFSEREAILCFAWSRLAVIETMSLHGLTRDSTLNFEGWLEAIARLACLKALPTCQEIRDAGCKTAGEYMDMLKAQDEEAYTTMLKERQTEWGRMPTNLPFFHSVSHMIELILHRIETTLGVTGGQITEEEMRMWMARQHLSG